MNWSPLLAFFFLFGAATAKVDGASSGLIPSGMSMVGQVSNGQPIVAYGTSGEEVTGGQFPSSALTNSQVQSANIANDAVGPVQASAQMNFVTNGGINSLVVPGNTGIWYRMGQVSTSSFALTTFELQYTDGPLLGLGGKLVFKAGRFPVTAVNQGIAVLYAESWAQTNNGNRIGTNGFGGLVNVAGNYYFQLTNSSHLTITCLVQAIGWCESNPDMFPQNMWSMTVQDIGSFPASSGSTITYLTPGTPLIRYSRGAFDSLTLGVETRTNWPSGGGTVVTDVVFAVRNIGQAYAGSAITTQSFPTALRNDSSVWNTNTFTWTPTGTGVGFVQTVTYLTNNAIGGRITLFHYVNGVLRYAYHDSGLSALNDVKISASRFFVITNAADVHSFTLYNVGGMGAYDGAPDFNNITLWRNP